MFPSQQLQNLDWQRLPNSHYCYSPSTPLHQNPSASIFLGRSHHNFSHPYFLALKKYSSEEKPNQIIQDLIGERLTNVVEFYEVGLETPCYTLMQLCGRNLKDYAIEEELTGRTQKVLGFAEQMINGLKELKRHRIIHGDVKPQNIVLTEKDVIKFCDLDYSLRQKQASSKRLRVGTLEYMAPQILFEGLCSYKSDIWSLGIVLFELHFGHHPWHQDNQQYSSSEEIFVKYYRKIKTELNKLRERLIIIKENSQSKSVAIIMELILSCLVLEPQNRRKIEDLSILVSKSQKPRKCSWDGKNKIEFLNQPFVLSNKTLPKMFSNILSDLSGFPSTEILLKKTKDLSNCIQKLVRILNDENGVNMNSLRDLIDKFKVESSKVSEIIRSNFKRLGNKSIKIGSYEHKLVFAEHLQIANVYLESLDLEQESHHGHPLVRSVDILPA